MHCWSFGARAFSGSITDEELLDSDPTVSSQYMPARLGGIAGAQSHIDWTGDNFGFTTAVGNARETDAILGGVPDCWQMEASARNVRRWHTKNGIGHIMVNRILLSDDNKIVPSLLNLSDIAGASAAVQICWTWKQYRLCQGAVFVYDKILHALQ